MPVVTKSLRQYLQGSLVDFAESCDMAPLVTATSLTSLIVALADLREEGAVLVPEVFLCDDLSALLKLLPGNERLFIGTQADAQTAVAEALKKCAPLAIGGWCMFVTRSVEVSATGCFGALLVL